MNWSENINKNPCRRKRGLFFQLFDRIKKKVLKYQRSKSMVLDGRVKRDYDQGDEILQKNQDFLCT
jgi:hypothetical protein